MLRGCHRIGFWGGIKDRPWFMTRAPNIDPLFAWRLPRANSPLRPVKGRGTKEVPRSFAPRMIADELRN